RDTACPSRRSFRRPTSRRNGAKSKMAPDIRPLQNISDPAKDPTGRSGRASRRTDGYRTLEKEIHIMRHSKLFVTLTFVLALTPSLYAQSSPADSGEPHALFAQRSTLLGSWVVSVDSTATPDFTALQTFQLGGTVSETTDLLAQGGEGPGHGAWERTANGYSVTFELFIFNP